MMAHLKTLSFLLAVGLCVSAAVLLSQPVNSSVAVSNDTVRSEKDVIAGYKHWTQVNKEPQVVPSRIAIQCAAPTVAERSLEDQNPHRDKFVVVYVNDIGRVAMLEKKYPVFPQGSVIVKEKLITKDSTSPELLTVMRKREPGYDPKNGDWEYMVFDGAAQTVQASGKLEKCQACHEEEKGSDYVSRRYIPYDTLNKMK
jgi:hypothetical protein